MLKRIALVQKELRSLDIPAILVTNMSDVFYLSGFTGSTGCMIIDLEKAVFFTDGRYTLQAAYEVDENVIVETVKDYSIVYTERCAVYKKILLQPCCPLEISSKILSKEVEIYMDEHDFLRKHRMLKTAQEIEEIKSEYELAGKSFLKALKSFQYGMSEKSWAAALEYHMKMNGAKGESFETIVASGSRGAMPHGTASMKKVAAGEPVIIDFGSRRRYTSDYTRMVYNGNDEEVLKVIDIVRSALEKSIEAIREGVKCSDVDSIARTYISEHGYGQYFNHSLGHGVGIDVHEYPVLSGRSDMVLEDYMVFTVEPGIYIPDKFGVRLEQTVLLAGGKPELLSGMLDKYVYEI